MKTKTKVSINVDSVEVGYGFITIWSNDYPAIREFGKELYLMLSEDLQRINQEDLWFHSPPLFHPYGQGPDTGRKIFKHMHILYDHKPDDKDLKELLNIIGLDHSNVRIETLEDHKDPKINRHEALDMSKQEYIKVLQEYIDGE